MFPLTRMFLLAVMHIPATGLFHGFRFFTQKTMSILQASVYQFDPKFVSQIDMQYEWNSQDECIYSKRAWKSGFKNLHSFLGLVTFFGYLEVFLLLLLLLLFFVWLGVFLLFLLKKLLLSISYLQKLWSAGSFYFALMTQTWQGEILSKIMMSI